MSKAHRVQVYSPKGSYVVKHFSPRLINELSRAGNIVFHAQSRQWRVVNHTEQNLAPVPVRYSPASISFEDVQSFVGLNGPHLQRAAQDKVNSWSTVHDDKCLIVCANKVYRPREK